MSQAAGTAAEDDWGAAMVQAENGDADDGKRGDKEGTHARARTGNKEVEPSGYWQCNVDVGTPHGVMTMRTGTTARPALAAMAEADITEVLGRHDKEIQHVRVKGSCTGVVEARFSAAELYKLATKTVLLYDRIELLRSSTITIPAGVTFPIAAVIQLKIGANKLKAANTGMDDEVMEERLQVVHVKETFQLRSKGVPDKAELLGFTVNDESLIACVKAIDEKERHHVRIRPGVTNAKEGEAVASGQKETLEMRLPGLNTWVPFENLGITRAIRVGVYSPDFSQGDFEEAELFARLSQSAMGTAMNASNAKKWLGFKGTILSVDVPIHKWRAVRAKVDEAIRMCAEEKVLGVEMAMSNTEPARKMRVVIADTGDIIDQDLPRRP